MTMDEELIRGIQEKLGQIDHDIDIIVTEIWGLEAQKQEREEKLAELQQLQNTLTETQKTMKELTGVSA